MSISAWMRHGLAGVVLAAFAGCNAQPSGNFKTASQLKKDGVTDAAKEHHGHAEPGPHKGALHEVGEDEFHLELVADHDRHALTVYLLGSDAKSNAGSPAKELVISAEGGTKFTLKPVPQDGDAEGTSSRFELVDEKLVHDLLDAGFLHGTTNVSLGGKEFKVSLDAHFDDHDHDHDHKKEEPKK